MVTVIAQVVMVAEVTEVMVMMETSNGDEGRGWTARGKRGRVMVVALTKHIKTPTTQL